MGTGTLAAFKGEFQVAREICDRVEETNPSQPGLIVHRILLQYEAGDFDQGAASVERLFDLVRHYPPGPSVVSISPATLLPLVARVTGDLDLLEVAKVAAETILSSPTATPLVIRLARIGLGLIAVLLGDIDEAREQYTALEPGRGTITAPGYIAADHLLGLLAQTMGNLDLAVGHFDDSLSFCRRGGFRPELAWTCFDYADTLLQRQGPGDREKATTMLDESLAISSELGMRPLMERVLSRREILKA
jgi:tetratricopeptide (TPR) repeat protein